MASDLPPDTDALSVLVTATGLLAGVRDLTASTARLPAGLSGQVLAGASRIADASGRGAADFDGDADRRAIAGALIQVAYHCATAAVCLIAVSRGVAPASLGLSFEGQEHGGAPPRLEVINGGAAESASAGGRRINTTLEGGS